VEADERERGGGLGPLGARRAGAVGDDKRDAVPGEECERLRREPALVTELDGVTQVAGKRGKRRLAEALTA